MTEVDEALVAAQRLGFLGSAPIRVHRAVAEAFLAPLEAAAPVLDLGSGGGVPGLVLAEALLDTRFVLLDARQVRTDFLRRVVHRLGWSGRVEVVHGRAEEVAHEPDRRSAFGAVVSRGFGPPARTAECAAGFLRVGGRLLVSAPPDTAVNRWPVEGLAKLGLAPGGESTSAGIVERLWQQSVCPAHYPRRSARPPLW